MKRAPFLILAAGVLVGGCGQQSPESYSADLSAEVKKPRADGLPLGRDPPNLNDWKRESKSRCGS
jgi:hypothetical protein